MDFNYDPDADGLMIRLADGDYAESEEVHPGLVLDFDKQGRILRIEVLPASKVLAPGAWSKPAKMLSAPNDLQAAE